ncbi:hypothetical protein SEA_CULVER_57 [Gordonia phage Culver]|nr:hypothetical protein SEA_CULVER_57 [Gordonia phage Culver]
MPEIRLVTKDGADAAYAPVALVADTIHYPPGAENPDYQIEGGVRTDYTYDSEGKCITETRLGKVKTWTYDSAGNPISSTVTEA